MRSWPELYLARPCISKLHVIVCGEPRGGVDIFKYSVERDL